MQGRLSQGKEKKGKDPNNPCPNDTFHRRKKEKDFFSSPRSAAPHKKFAHLHSDLVEEEETKKVVRKKNEKKGNPN